MSENSPRWPGINGPGLDFSPYRTRTADSKDAGDADGADGAARDALREADDTSIGGQAPARATEGAERPEAPRTSESSTKLTPGAQNRAAEAAKSWATRPPAGAAARTSTGGPGRPGFGAAGATAVGATGAAAAGGAGAAGATSKLAPGVAGPGAARASQPVTDPEKAGADAVMALGEDEAGGKTGGKPDVTIPSRAERRARRTRKARLRLSRIDPWSVMKTSFLFSIAFGVMLWVATFVVWSIFAGSGALEAVNGLLNQLLGDTETQINVTDVLSTNRVLGLAAIIAAIDVVILTAVATLFAFLYNLAAIIMGGLEVTLAED